MVAKVRWCCALLLGLALATACLALAACDDEEGDEDAGPDAAYKNDEVEHWTPDDESGGGGEGGGSGPGDDPGEIPGPGPGGPGPDPP